MNEFVDSSRQHAAEAEVNLPADAEFRERALDPASSFIVQAPAGSGKTELLTRRVLTLLACVDEPEEILAITFTRKAASEMRQRVMESLFAAQSDIAPASSYEAQGRALALAVLERDTDREWQLLRNPQRLNLRTIDALCTSLAHRLPVVSQLGAPAAVVEDAMPLYRLAASQLLDAQVGSLDLVLLQLGNRLDNAQSLLAEMLANRDQWQRYVWGYTDMDALRGELERMLGELVQSRLSRLQDCMPDRLDEVLPALLREAARIFLALKVSDKPSDVKAQALLADLDVLPGGDADDVVMWQAIAHALLTQAGTARKSVTRGNGFPVAAKDATALDMSVADLKALKERMSSLLKELGEYPEFVELLQEVRSLPLGGYREDDWALLEQLLRVLPDLLIELLSVFTERGVVDFVEMAMRAQLALGTSDAPTDLALALDLRLKHLLIDEFQDTSRTQFKLFELLVAGWERDDGRSFFAVGDPMQSIYRFRDADVTLFEQARDSGIGGLELTPLTLSVNFRAAPAVIGWVNDTFAGLFPQQSDVAIGAVSYAASVAHLTGNGGVQVHALVDQDNQAEARKVASLAAEAIALDTQHRVAILVRSRAQAADIFTALQQCGIAYQAIDMDLLGDRPVVRDLLSLCLALRYPHDRLHWLAILRAPWCGLTLADLHVLMQDSHQQPLIELLNEPERREALSDDGRARIERLLDVIEPAVQRAPRAALMPWVEACWLQLGGPAVCRDRVDLDAAERCIARLQNLEASGQLWQPSVLRTAMQSLYAAASDDASVQVQIMTLHKAKGLEFDTVILPALGRRPRGDQQKLLNWFESTIDGEQQLLLAPITERGAGPDPINELVRRARSRCDTQEKLRLLYVACTRAKSQLHLVGQARHKQDGSLGVPSVNSLLHPLWPRLEPDFLRAAELDTAELDTHVSEATDSPIAKPDTHISRTTDSPVEKPGAHAQGTESSDHQQAPASPRKTTQISFEFDADPVKPEHPGNGSLPNTGETLLDTKSSGTTDSAPPLRRLPLDWSPPELSRFSWSQLEKPPKPTTQAVEYQWAGTAARDIGTVVHRQLQRFAEQPEPLSTDLLDGLPDIVERQLRNVGVPKVKLPGAVEQVMRALGNTLEDERGRWVLSGEHQQARSEWALSVVEDGWVRRVIIDRTFVDTDGVRWVVDFKTGDHRGGNLATFLDQEQERYADQLSRYADIIRRMDKHPIRLGLYFPMVRGWREIDFPAGKLS